jgi:hypothetical protein
MPSEMALAFKVGGQLQSLYRENLGKAIAFKKERKKGTFPKIHTCNDVYLRAIPG